ncbi:MAG: carboxylate-amine ligase [Acidobacteria bacterium]|nr:carboxylate-amine ligase [Acidobacteriota bacterium]MCB9397612.1 carboxylate-amine ligase [Acidobacteriota bacterium]
MVWSATTFPPPGSAEEHETFIKLQAKLKSYYQKIAADRNEAHTTIIVPSLSMNEAELRKISGVASYEERLLCLLMLLQRPRTRIVFLSSVQIHPVIVQYYLNFLSGIPYSHAMRRLVLLDAVDASPKPLTQKILERPWLMDRITKAMGDPDRSHMVVFNTSPLERTLAVRLGVPVYGVDPSLLHLGNKSGGRRVFKEADIPLPAGFEDLYSEDEVVEGLDRLWQEESGILRAVVKLNDGFAGAGNALFDYRPLMDYKQAAPNERKTKLAAALHDMRFEADGETWPNFRTQFREMGGVVETFIEGDVKYSPSVQARVNAANQPQVISTHDQILGGSTGQTFLGCRFPARPDYRLQLQEDGRKIAEVLSHKGVLGRFAVDFIVVPTPNGFQRYAIEINMRKGGTTHPFLVMKFLIEGGYDESSGIYISALGEEKYYLATDNIFDKKFPGMGPEDLIDALVYHRIHFHSQLQRGVVFHMIGAMSQHGKLGITCIGNSVEETNQLNRATIEALSKEADPEGRHQRLEFY